MTLPLLVYGDPLLRRRAEPVARFDGELRELIHALEKTMIAHDGCGLAAPQVGRQLRVFIARAPLNGKTPSEAQEPAPLRAFINPKLFDLSPDSATLVEGCLSIPGVSAEVMRPTSLRVEFLDVEGASRTERFTGFMARVIMHENDHLNGRLFIDRVTPGERARLSRALRSLKRRGSIKPP